MTRILGLWDSIAIVIGIVVGVGIFKTPAEIAQYLPSPLWMLAAWLTGGIISFIGALCYAELASSFPETGGNYLYLKKSYGPFIAFLYGWIELAVIRPGSIAAVSFILAEALVSFSSLGPQMVRPAAVTFISLLVWINLRGLSHSKKVQNAAVSIVLLVLFSTIILGIFSREGNFHHFEVAGFSPGINLFRQFGLALVPILWTYGGWHENTFMGGETRNPSRLIPAALFIALSLIALLYLSINFIYLYLMPVETVASSRLIMSEVLKILAGRFGEKFIEVLIIFTSLACINGIMMTGSRMAYALASDYAGLKKDETKLLNGTIYLMAALSILMVAFGAFGSLLFFTGIVVWLFFGLVAAGLLILRRKYPDLPRPYRVLFYPVTPILFLFVCSGLFLNTLVSFPMQSFLGLGFIVLGMPVYFVCKKFHKYILQFFFVNLLIGTTLPLHLGFSSSPQNEFQAAKEEMVREQLAARGIRDPKVLQAMTKVKRHLFVPESMAPFAYQDTPLPIGHGQTISQPYVVAYMTEALGLGPDDRVLEIGTGSGYQAAILAEIVKKVYSIEIVPELAEEAGKRLRELGYSNVKVKHGDGYQGWPEFQPFDAIIVTAAPETVPQKLIDQLETPGGRMILPVGSFDQELLLIRKIEKGITEKKLFPVRFVPMIKKESSDINHGDP